jgi:hypothetical protein
MNEEDQKAKERARARSGTVVRPAASSLENKSDAAARLDNRIAGNRKDFNGASDKDAKDKARTTGSNPGMKRAPPSSLKELSRMEADAAAKSRARSGSAQPAIPGAFKMESPSVREDLTQMESDIAAKSGARRPTAHSSSPGAYSSGIRSEIAELQAQATGKPRHNLSGAPSDLNQLDADVAAKSSARNSVLGSSPREAPSARTELSRLESDVAAKALARPAQPATTPGARYELRSMEDAIAEKGQGASTNKTRTDLCDLESDIAAKQGQRTSPSSSRPGMTNVRDLDERIAYKTGIPLDREEKDDNSAEDRRNLQDNVAKLTGLPPSAVSAALEKFQGRPGGSALSAMENKLDGYHAPSSGDPNSQFQDVEPGQEAGHEAGDRLAVAIAVKEDEDDVFIPAAVEYDPDAKPPIYKNRRFRLYGLLACTLLVVVVAGVVGLLAQKDLPVLVYEPTLAPTSLRYTLGIQEQLELVVGSEKLNDPKSAQYRAKEWIINDDPMQLSPNDANLMQRFLLAVFYFKTHEEGDWLSCNAPDEDSDDFCFYQKLVGVFPTEYRGVAWYRWLSGNHECMWAGIFCDEFDQLRSLDLAGQQITGTLPIELTYFPFLQGIALMWNNFHGSIPQGYGEIKHLLNLEIHYNQLTGTLPNDWSKAQNVQLFNIAANEITGTLPSDIKNLSNLKGIFFYENFLTGTFPTEFAAMSLLSKCSFFPSLLRI